MGNILDSLSGPAYRRERKRRIQAEKERDLALGNFYSFVEEVWDFECTQFAKQDLDRVRRKDVPQFYKDAVEVARTCTTPNPADDSSRSTGSSVQGYANATSTASRKDRLEKVRIDGTCGRGEKAHLIPHSPNSACFFGHLAEAATAVNFNDDSTEMRQKRRMVLVHGQKYQPKSGPKRRRLNTGIKHDLMNNARILDQGYYLDSDPSLLLIPVLTLQETLDYQSGGNFHYHVVVACRKPEAYQRCGLSKEYDRCTEEEVQIATKTLASFVKAAAYTLTLADDETIANKIKEPKKKQIINTKEEIAAGDKLKIPKMLRPWNKDTKLPRLTFGTEDPNLHHDCDPFLLFVRAAVVWSSIQKQLLLPPCPDPPDCEECLEAGLLECLCDAHGPGSIPTIPSEIEITNTAVDDDDDDTIAVEAVGSGASF
eukprot:scaffold2557_cov121-Cylindrotheca_fusiformis.AAC.20